MNLLFRFLLTLNATSWMVIIYGIKQSWAIGPVPTWSVGLLLLCIPIILSVSSIVIASRLGSDSIHGCSECCLADQEFLPVYLGYFFVSLSANNDITMMFLYSIVFAFTFVSQTQYFNPIFLLFGYHYYHVLTPQGTRIFIITRGKVIRSKNNMTFDDLRRINDTSYIARKGR